MDHSSPEPTAPQAKTPALPAQMTVPRHSNKKIVWITGTVIVVLIVGAAVFAVWHHSTHPAAAKTAGTAATSSAPHTSSEAAPAAGTDDSTINSQINSAESAINQTAGDQSAADNALNDSSREITVPTN